MRGTLPSSINYHITERCNYRCRFCFACYHQYNKELSLKDSFKLIDLLVDTGCEKLNFAGGEPTLVPHLPKLINYANDNHLFVSLISNGTGITKAFIEETRGSIDLLGLSIDSNFDTIEIALGRTIRKLYQTSNFYSHVDLIKKRSKLIKKYGINLKINTVLTNLNWKEDMTGLILELEPIRWKIFEVTYIRNVNDSFFDKHKNLHSWQIQVFKKRHEYFNPILEKQRSIIESYCMITPDGRFYQNSKHIHNYSDSILKAGIVESFNQIYFSESKYKIRDGEYFKKIYF